jgi:hypothetical protein
MPLLVSTGVYTDLAQLGTVKDLASVAATAVWGDKGVVVYTVGNSAEFKKARASGAATNVERIADPDVLTAYSATVTLIKPQ